jgi:hypothetical protein
VTNEEIEALLFEHLPKPYLAKLLGACFLAHETSWSECHARHAYPEVVNVLGWDRRAKVETYIRDTTKLSSETFDDLRVETKKNKKSGWWHNEVWSGPVVLTASSVQTPCELVEPSEYRVVLSEYVQPPLWGDAPKATASGDAVLYGILLHGRSHWKADEAKKYGYLLGSAHLGFPLPSLVGYRHSINLFDLFPQVVGDHMPREWDEEAQIRYLQKARGLAVA